MLFCDFLNKLIVFSTTVPGSHECPDYHAVHYCAQTARYFCKKKKYCDIYQLGQVLSPNLGQVLPHSLFMIHCHIIYKQPLQMVKGPIGDQGLSISLPQ